MKRLFALSALVFLSAPVFCEEASLAIFKSYGSKPDKPSAPAETKTQAEISSVTLRGYISFWTQSCEGAKCGLPSSIKKNEPIEISLAAPKGCGEFTVAKAKTSVDTVSAAVSVYAIRSSEEEGCALAFQAQAELTGTVIAQCAARLNLADTIPFPVMTCAGPLGYNRRLGLTLHRKLL